MGTVTCRVYALDTTMANDPIATALVRVFDSTGTVFVTSGTTDVDGLFQVDLTGTASPNPTRYQLRCSKLGVSFTNPEYIDVYDPLPVGVVNDFNVYGNIHEVENAHNPLMCRASGFFADPGGRPIEDLLIRFMNLFDPVVVGGVGMTTKIEVRTDADGWAVVELPRGGKYIATVSGLQDETIKVTVPDRGGVSLTDLLFPVISTVAFDPVAPWSVTVGSELTLTPTVTTTAYVVLEGTANGDLDYTVEDTTVASVTVYDDTIAITGVATGTTSLTITVKDDSTRRIPAVTLVGTGGVITVA